MSRIIDLAAVVRSKNAGPLWLTLDIMFDGRARYLEVLHADAFSAETIGALYGVDPLLVSIIPYDAVCSVKVTIPRRCVSGDLTAVWMPE